MPSSNDLELLRDNALSPASLTVDHAGNVIVLTSTGGAYAFKPGASDDQITVLNPTAMEPHPGGTVVVPTTRWRDSHDFLSVNQKPTPWQIVSPDGTLFIPVSNEFKNAGPNSALFSTIDLIRAYQLTSAKVGGTVYIADEFGQKTYAYTVNSDGSLANPRLIAEEGEGGVATDAQGNIYVCAGDIFVYTSAGRLINKIQLPERPTSIVCARDGKTLYVAARTSLYEVTLR